MTRHEKFAEAPTSPRRLPACVMGGFDLVRPLALAGIASAVVARPGSPALYSRSTRARLPWADFDEGVDDLVEALMRFGAAQPEPPVLFYEEDAQLLIVSRHRKRLARAFRFVVADETLVEDLVDKARFQTLAERMQLPVPATRRFLAAAGSAPVDLDLAFPLIVKPLTRDKPWEAIEPAHKALQVDTREALRQLWPRFAAAGAELLAQELVPGPESRIESYHVYVDGLGSIAGEFTGRKIRTYPASLGHSTALEISDAADVASLGRSLVERLGLRGVAKLDFKRDPGGRLHLLEINPRFTCGTISAPLRA